MSKISATIVADSINQQGDRITTMLVTFPRFILAELNTHRMLSKNSASSRAIPFKKMVESITNDPFIPIAWQKEHSGMQGTEYITDKNETEYNISNWLQARDYALDQANYLTTNKVTKQLCNRLLEPFMWHTVLITATEWENFFALRCPQYEHEPDLLRPKRSRKDWINFNNELTNEKLRKPQSEINWLLINKGQAEIHMMALAEAMWDAMNESAPKLLQPGQWHIPFGDKIDWNKDFQGFYYSQKDPDENLLAVKISTAMAARTSYTVVGDEKEFSYEKQIELHDRMANQVPFHASPFEHCARAMTNDEYYQYFKGPKYFNGNGWCRNYKGFIQYREILENDKS